MLLYSTFLKVLTCSKAVKPCILAYEHIYTHISALLQGVLIAVLNELCTGFQGRKHGAQKGFKGVNEAMVGKGAAEDLFLLSSHQKQN